MNKKFSLKKAFNIIIFILLLIVLFIYFVIVANSIIKKESTLNFFKWKPFIVVSDCPDVNVHSGDMAIIKDVKVEEMKTGDAIVYKRGNDATIITIKDVKKDENGESKIVIENDNIIKNETINSYVEGKYMFKIAGLGNLMLFLQTPLGGIVLISIFLYSICIIKLIGSKTNNNNEEVTDTLNIENKTEEKNNKKAKENKQKTEEKETEEKNIKETKDKIDEENKNVQEQLNKNIEKLKKVNNRSTNKKPKEE